MRFRLSALALALAFLATLGSVGGASPPPAATTIIGTAIAAAEAAVGLAIFIGIFRTRQTVDVDELDALRDDT